MNKRVVKTAVVISFLVGCFSLYGCGGSTTVTDQTSTTMSETVAGNEEDSPAAITEETKEEEFVEVESVTIKEENINCVKGKTKNVTISIIPTRADASQLELVVGDADVISANMGNAVLGDINVTIEGLKEGETQLSVRKGSTDMCTMNVTVEGQTYTLDELPDGVFYGRNDKIYKLESDKLYTYKDFDTFIGLIPAEEFSEDTVPVINRGETIYIKGEDKGQFYSCYLDGSEPFNDLPSRDYFGYFYPYKIKTSMTASSVSFVDYKTGDIVFSTEVSYVNDEEIGWYNYCMRTWNSPDPTISEIFSTTQEGDTLTIGGFEGTEYKEKTITTDMWIAITQKAISGDDIQLTKDGYAFYTFPVDCRPGYYYFQQYSYDDLDYDHYWINVK